VLCANGHLERGERIETWLPEVPTDYSYDLVVPEATPPRILLYPSGVRQNLIWHGNSWTVKHWVETVRLLNQQNHIPVLIGADNPDDLTYNRWLTKQLTMHGLSADSLVGKTSVADVFGMIKSCRVVAGLNSGLVIVAAALGVPTVLMWSNEQTRCPGSHSTLPREMQTSWLPEDLPSAYRPMSLGSRQLTPSGLVENMLEVLR
jgi:ADP-heptose:LPS heptosyltransferase